MISCFANNVKQAYIYIRGEMPHGARILEKAIAGVARAANFCGPKISAARVTVAKSFRHRVRGRLHLRRGDPGLIESLEEGKRA